MTNVFWKSNNSLLSKVKDYIFFSRLVADSNLIVS
jgi:hypothetical protein